MQVTIQPNQYTFFRNFYKASETDLKARSGERQQRQIMTDYLPAEEDHRVLNLTSGDGCFGDLCSDQANPGPGVAGHDVASSSNGQPESLPTSFRTPFGRETFNGVVSFDLGSQLGTEGLEDLLWEAGRVCTPGGRVIIGVPSAERRQLFRRPKAESCGAKDFTAAEVADCRGTRWQEVAVIGIDLLPVERLPNWLRGPAGRLNDRLCRTPLRKFAKSRAYVLELR